MTLNPTCHNELQNTDCPYIQNHRPNRIPFRKQGDPQALQSYGDPITQVEKQSRAIRIFFQNIKGLSYTNTTEDYKYVFRQLEDLQIDIAGLAETNTAWQHTFLRNELLTAARSIGAGQTSRISFASPSTQIDAIPNKETFQAGGSITTTTGAWTTTTLGPDIQDPTGLGRWSGMHFRGKNRNVLSIITGYRTCTGTRLSSHIGSTFHREHEFFSSQKEKCSINPRRQFFVDLESTIRDLLDAQHSIILMLDANAVITQDRYFRESMERLQMIDLHDNDPAPSTYIGATNRRIGYMFGSLSVASAKLAGGTLSYVEGPQSDHRGLYVDVCADSILHYHAMDNSIQSPQARILKSGNPELVANYIEHVRQYYDDHAMAHRINDLHARHQSMSDEELRHKLYSWDEDQGRAMIHAEKAIGRRGISKKNHWSPVLRNAGIVCRYWRLRLQARNPSDYSATYTRLTRAAQQHDPQFTLPFLGTSMKSQEIAQQLKLAIRHLKKCQKDSRDLRHRTYQELLIRYETTTTHLHKPNLPVEQKSSATQCARKKYERIFGISDWQQNHSNRSRVA